MDVPYVNLQAQHAPIKGELMAAIERVIDHGQFILGSEVSTFEERFATLCDAKYAVGVNSGTDALILALRALGIGPGDEVLTPPNSFVASTSCITLVGAHPVFVDVGDDYNIDPAALERHITPRTKAILPVHLTGRPADMDPIMEVARKHNLSVIEDCAQAVGATYKGRPVGSIGTVGCFSLHPLKTLNACGDGGVLVTSDPNLSHEFTNLRNIGLETRDNCVIWSGNSRLDTMQAAILLVKMDYIEQWTDSRRANAAKYRERLAGIPEISTPQDKEYEQAVYHTFVVTAERRDELQKYLAGKGVATAIHYPIPIHLQDVSAYLNCGPGSFPNTEKQAQMVLSLPVYPELEPEQLEFVSDCIRSFYD